MKDFFGYKVTLYGVVFSPKGVMMRPFLDKDGYNKLRLTIQGKTKNYFVHRLVAILYISNDYNKPEVNHIDGNKLNNHFENLEWVTRSENQKHAYDIGLQKRQQGSDRYNSKLNEVRVRIIRKLYPSISQGSLARKYMISQPVVSEIINRKTWCHV